jgi:hypothetical protein
MPVAVPFSAPMALSRGASNKRTQNIRQPIHNISLLPAPMMSRMSGWRHVAMLGKTLGVVTGMLSYGSGVIAAIGSGPK